MLRSGKWIPWISSDRDQKVILRLPTHELMSWKPAFSRNREGVQDTRGNGAQLGLGGSSGYSRPFFTYRVYEGMKRYLLDFCSRHTVISKPFRSKSNARAKSNPMQKVREVMMMMLDSCSRPGYSQLRDLLANLCRNSIGSLSLGGKTRGESL